MRRKIFPVIVFSLFLALSSISLAERKEVKAMFGAHAWKDVIIANLPQFEKETGIKVEYEVLSEDVLFERAILELTSGTGSYDVIADVIEWVAPYAATGGVEPLDKYDAKYQLNLKDKIAAVRKAHMFKNKQYSLPINCGSRMFYYRKDLLAREGLSVPKTWEELKTAAKKLTKGNTYGMSMSARKGAIGVLNWMPWFWAAGGREWDGHRVKFNSEAGIAATQLWIDLINSKSTPPGITNFAIDDNKSGIMRGTIGMASFETAAALDLANQSKNPYAASMGFDLVPARFKKTKRTATAVLGGWGFTLTKQSRNKDAALKFLAWATSKSMDQKFALTFGQGAYPESYTSEAVVQKFPALPFVLNTLNGAKTLFPIPENQELADILTTELTAAFSGQKTAKQAMDDATSRMNDVLAKAGY
jgi:multiple sugar transport system substrate-binding protein